MPQSQQMPWEELHSTKTDPHASDQAYKDQQGMRTPREYNRTQLCIMNDVITIRKVLLARCCCNSSVHEKARELQAAIAQTAPKKTSMRTRETLSEIRQLMQYGLLSGSAWL